MSKNPIRVMSSILTGRIYAGRVNPKNQMFIGEKDDVTDTAVSAVAQHLLKEEVCLQFEVKGKTYRLEVRGGRSMNTQNKPELFAPCFPMLSIKKSGIEVDADNVQFSFVVGNESIDCEIKAVELTDSMYVEQQFHPKSGRDVDYIKLEVDNKTLALVTRSDFEETPAGLHFILTESQVYELNEWLEADAVEKFEMAQG